MGWIFPTTSNDQYRQNKILRRTTRLQVRQQYIPFRTFDDHPSTRATSQTEEFHYDDSNKRDHGRCFLFLRPWGISGHLIMMPFHLHDDMGADEVRNFELNVDSFLDLCDSQLRCCGP
ncbi:hypothetical protein TNIN_136981 [Trichonephila inaurata madagascariensis]|uniref:Uncharacterized protein n=1 Tax=Trichonephila inaurata madagascariensis TaxID=2747483 RepID=A0A8X6XN82_9ARAC|nr:hypothetical protein TNIN_136981 [Trichonephila inaurata madagascariensis]